MDKIISRNPRTGQVIAELPATSVDDLSKIFTRAREAQSRWALLTPKRRASILLQLRETLIRRSEDLVDVIAKENGKPRFEAMANEIVPSVALITYFAKRAPKLLRDKRIPMTVMLHRQSYLNYWPLGVVAVISPWNYPMLLPFGEIVMALIAGNAVVFKPSEVTPLIGLKILEICEEAGLPSDLLQVVIGDGRLGAAIIKQRPDKIFFTGSVATGKKIMAAAAENLTPVSLELGGKDAMIVLADADLDFATSAALWGGFSNSGQVCASVERILVHETIAAEFNSRLAAKIATLRHTAGHADSFDLGSVTFEKQKEVYRQQIDAARAAGAQFVTGGDFSADQTYLAPTIVTGPGIENLDVYNEETFGPVVAVTTFRTVNEAIAKANQSRYGLLASVITRDLHLGEQVARQLEVGTVTINEVTYTAGLAETPWGGIKESGIGRKHADMGLLEFTNVRHIHKPVSSHLVFKSWWWFPYTDYQYIVFQKFMNMYRRSWLEKARNLPHLLWNFIQFVKKEKRI